MLATGAWALTKSQTIMFKCPIVTGNAPIALLLLPKIPKIILKFVKRGLLGLSDYNNKRYRDSHENIDRNGKLFLFSTF